MKALKLLMIFLAFTVVGCNSDDQKENYVKKKFDVIVDVQVLPTSSNERMKVQIKTKRKFFVISTDYPFPQLTFGDSLTGLFSGQELVYVVDDRGQRFKVR